MKYQNGSLRKKTRKDGSQVWVFRYRVNGKPAQKTLSVSEYPAVGSVKVQLQALIFSLNDKATMTKTTPFGMVVERFIVEERLREILAQPTGAVTEKDGLAFSTANRYISTFKCHILPRWGTIPIGDIRAIDVLSWIKDLPVAGTTKSGVKALMHYMFEKAMLWEMLEIQRNPIDLVKIKGASIRKKKKVILTPEQFWELHALLPEQIAEMCWFASFTGLRVSELTALRREHIVEGILYPQAACFHGRVGAVKTESSLGEIPLDPAIMERLKLPAEGLLFPTAAGGNHFGGKIQQEVLRPLGRKLWGVDNLGWHSFRHTYRAWHDESGTAIGVQQKLMRHANVSTTMNVYGASAMRSKREANSKVVQMVLGRMA